MHHFDPDLKPEVRKAREHFIEQREKQLQSITVTAVESGVRFLFTTNAGGAIAVLTYLGAIASNANQTQTLKSSLAYFFLGIILVGLYRAFLAETYGKMFKNFQLQTANYFSSEKEWESYISEIKAEVETLRKSQVGRILIYGSFLCFVLGSAIGTFSLFI